MWKVILDIIASAFKYFSNQQLLDAGKAEEKVNQMEAGNEAKSKAKSTKAKIVNLDSASVRSKLQKYRRD